MTTAGRRLTAALVWLSASGAALGLAAPDAAAQTATATVTFEVREINELSLSGDPEPLVLTRTGDDSTLEIVDVRTTWDVTTNQPDRKVTALLDADLPAGLTLTVALDPPAGAVGQGPVALATTARDLVVDFGSLQASRLGVTYTLAATPEAGVVSRTSRTVTYTILAGI